MKKSGFYWLFLSIAVILLIGLVSAYSFSDFWNKITGKDIINSKELVLYYPFEGNANDSSGNDINGLINGAELVLGKKGEAYHFNGLDNNIAINFDQRNYGLDKEYTLCAWIKLDSLTSDMHIISLSRYGYQNLKYSENHNSFVLTHCSNKTNCYDSIGTIKPKINRWYHVCGSIKPISGGNAEQKIYVNKIEEDGDIVDSGIYYYSMNNFIGLRMGDAGKYANYFNGTIDEVKIWDYALTENEIISEYESSCILQCFEKQCGYDECGRSCGNCDSGENCLNGKCINETKKCPNPGGCVYFKELQERFDDSISNNSYQKAFESEIYFSEPYIAGFISMYEAYQDEKYIELALTNIENMTNRLKDINGDGYLEWLSVYGRIRCISTERATRQFARLARIIKNDVYLDSKYGNRADNIIGIIKKDVINNPVCKSRFEKNYYNKLGVLHIISHPTLIMLELYLIEGNKTYLYDKDYGYLDSVTSNSEAMKNALLLHERNDNVNLYQWGAVWCKDLNQNYPYCYAFNDSFPCPDSQGRRLCFPSDTSHAEDFIFVAIELYRAGIIFKKDDIDLLANTFKYNVWNGDFDNPKYRDFIDGNLEPGIGHYYQIYNSSWSAGSNIAPGWVGLGAFDENIQNIIKKGDDSNVTNKISLNFLAYYGELARNIVVKECKYNNNAKEICDGVDNDCDGKIDEPFLDKEDICYSGIGECRNNGTITCSANGLGTECNAAAKNLSREKCDRKDNDCDGNIDEGCDCINEETQKCGTSDVGGCKYGIQTCVNGKWGECAGNIDPSAEICDGKDNDCNGLIDEEENSCDDGIGCSEDICAGILGCWHIENHRKCDDKLYCNGIEICSISGKKCIEGNPINCNDNYLCTDDSCDEISKKCINMENNYNCQEGQICNTLNFENGCGSAEECYDNDSDGFFDYDRHLCINGKDKCPYTNEEYFNKNPSEINKYLPHLGRFKANINKSKIYNLENFSLELSNQTKVTFRHKVGLVKINESGCFERIDFNSTNFINISGNKIFINGTFLKDFDSPAKIEFFGVNLFNPRIYKDGIECHNCNITNYTKGILLEIEVSGFSLYEIIEGPYCGDGLCNNAESCSTCSIDCGSCISNSPDDKDNRGSSWVGRINKNVQINKTDNICAETWICNDYSECINNRQVRECYDSNYCGTNKRIPQLEQICGEPDKKEKVREIKKNELIYMLIVFFNMTLIIILAILIIILFKRQEKGISP